MLFLPPVRGNRVGITGVSGGQSVAISDAFGEAGLKVPTLTDSSYQELASFFTLIGGGYRNPVDTGNQNRREIKRIIEILARDENIDNLALLTAAGMGPGGPPGESFPKLLIDIKQNTEKPVIAVLAWAFSPGDVEQAGKVMKELQEGGIPVFISLERGAFALRKALDYYNLRDGNP